jgi:hypothetical protein
MEVYRWNNKNIKEARMCTNIKMVYRCEAKLVIEAKLVY